MSKFYVYELIDPRDDEVFYVGKGKGRRWRDHATEAKAGKYSRKCDLIRDIMEDGFDYGVCFVSHHHLEADAYEAERLHIEAIGLDALTNVTPGGSGGYEIWKAPRTLTPQQVVKKCAHHIRKIMLCSDLGLRVTMKGVDLDLLALGRGVCMKLRDEVGVEEFDRVVRPFIVSNGGTECLS